MKSHFKILLIFFSLLFAVNCNKDSPIEPEGNYKVVGKIVLDGQPLEGATVQIDSILNWTTQTDIGGDFEIAGVTGGKHLFTTSKQIGDDKVVAKKDYIFLSKEVTDVGTIRLPTPPQMYEIDSTNVSWDKVPIYWSHSIDPEFREYKLYRRDTPGLDETTGELIFVSTSISDTHFVDTKFETGRTYYYRVYILSAFGKMGGSNLVQIKTPLRNFVENGGFEQTSDGIHPDCWEHAFEPPQAEFQVDSITVFQGKYSLHCFRENDQYSDATFKHTIKGENLQPGSRYKISVFMKSEGSELLYFMIRDYKELHIYEPNNSNTEWKEFSREFVMPGDVYRLDLFLGIDHDPAGDKSGWFDNVSITLVE